MWLPSKSTPADLQRQRGAAGLDGSFRQVGWQLWLLGQWRRTAGPDSHLSVITQFDGLLFTIGDGRNGQEMKGQQNGTGIATGAVLALGG